MKTLKQIRKIKLTTAPAIQGGCVERCVYREHNYANGVDFGPGIVCTFCYAV